MIAPLPDPRKRPNFSPAAAFMSPVLALLLALQAADLDGLRQADLEERTRAALRLRGRADTLPLLFQGLRDPDPEVRGRVADVLRFSSPLQWAGEAGLEALLRSPAPVDAAARSHRFLRLTMSGPQKLSRLVAEAPLYGQAVLLTGELRAETFERALTQTVVEHQDLIFLPSEGVIWAGYRRDLPQAPKLLAWLLKHLDAPDALLVLAQMLSPEQVQALIDDPRPEALELLLTAHALQRRESLPPGLMARLPERLRTAGPRGAAALSLVLRDYVAELSPILNAGAEGASRWGRYLSVATAAATPVKGLHSETFHRRLQDPEPLVRSQAIHAVLSNFSETDWDCKALLEAVEAHHEHLDRVRLTRSSRMQAAAVDSLSRTPDASLAVLEDCADSLILDAAVSALRRHPDRSLFARSTAALRRATEVGDDPEARSHLLAHFNGKDDDAAERAAYALGGLPAREILGILETNLQADQIAIRRRAFYAIRRLGSLVEPDSCLLDRLRGLLRAQAEVETDAWFCYHLLDLAEAPRFVAPGPHEIWTFWGRGGCGGRGIVREQGGWLALPAPAVALPDWKD